MYTIKSVIVLFTLLFFSTSCVNDLDFSQADTLEMNTPVTLSFVNFALSQEDLFDEDGAIILDFYDRTDFHFEDLISHTKDEVFNINTVFFNDFDTDFIFKMQFFNDSDELILTLSEIVIPLNEEVFNHSFTIQKDDFNTFINATNVKITLTPSNTDVIFPLLNQELIMRSSIRFLYQY